MAFNAWPRRGYILSEDCVYPGDDDYEGDNPWPGEDNNWQKAIDRLQGEIDTLSDTVDDIKVPTKVSELKNDSGFQTAAQVQSAIAAAAELPSVSASDNGKFLRVVSGAWAAASVPSAESNSFGGGS